MIRRLNTANEVIDALGGTLAVARLAGLSMQAISNWRLRERFPPATYLLLNAALRAKQCSAPTKLWDMIE